MASLADIIERYLTERLTRSDGGVLEVQRGELSAMFRCAPSQINYVLETRFPVARGFLVESRRGGGGFLRIIRLATPSSREVLDLLAEHVGERVGQERAEHLILRLRDTGVLSRREAALLLAAIHRQTIGAEPPLRDALRARLLKAMLLSLFRRDTVEGGSRDAL